MVRYCTSDMRRVRGNLFTLTQHRPKGREAKEGCTHQRLSNIGELGSSRNSIQHRRGLEKNRETKSSRIINPQPHAKDPPPISRYVHDPLPFYSVEP